MNQAFTMSSVGRAPFRATLMFVLLLGPAIVRAAADPPRAPAPVGVEIGRTTCQEAASVLGGAAEFSAKEQAFVVRSNAPASQYQGANQIEAWCSAPDSPVVLLTMRLAKGGMGNPGVVDAYTNLAGKYKRVAGGSPPRVGNGFARFVHGGTVIELDAPHLAFDFRLQYMTQAVYDNWRASEARRRESEAKARRDGL